jgi:hypothetical protein
MALPASVLPFHLSRSDDVVSFAEVFSTSEKIHGVLRLEAEALVVQWSTARETQRVGLVIETERTLAPVREVRLPLAALGGASLARPLWRWPPLGTVLRLRAADLHAFAALAGEAGLVLEHPAELTLGIQRRDRTLAREFAAELEMALAEQALGALEGRARLAAGEGPALDAPRRGALPASGMPVERGVADAGGERAP